MSRSNISTYMYFAVKWRLLCLFSFIYFTFFPCSIIKLPRFILFSRLHLVNLSGWTKFRLVKIPNLLFFMWLLIQTIYYLHHPAKFAYKFGTFLTDYWLAILAQWMSFCQNKIKECTVPQLHQKCNVTSK